MRQLTLRELERYIATRHRRAPIISPSPTVTLGRPPIAVWREATRGSIPLRLPQDRMRFWLTFLPEQERTLRPDRHSPVRPALFGSAALSADVGRCDRRPACQIRSAGYGCASSFNGHRGNFVGSSLCRSDTAFDHPARGGDRPTHPFWRKDAVKSTPRNYRPHRHRTARVGLRRQRRRTAAARRGIASSKSKSGWSGMGLAPRRRLQQTCTLCRGYRLS